MKKGFTLLELIVVIIILGILATMGVVQYTKMIERSRGAEARNILGYIRTNAASVYARDNNSCTNCTANNVSIGNDYPGPAAQNCIGTQYFWYNITPNANGFVATATRCLANGKTPQGTVADTLTLTTNFSLGGSDTWSSSGQY